MFKVIFREIRWGGGSNRAWSYPFLNPLGAVSNLSSLLDLSGPVHSVWRLPVDFWAASPAAHFFCLLSARIDRSTL